MHATPSFQTSIFSIPTIFVNGSQSKQSVFKKYDPKICISGDWSPTQSLQKVMVRFYVYHLITVFLTRVTRILWPRTSNPLSFLIKNK